MVPVGGLSFLVNHPNLLLWRLVRSYLGSHAWFPKEIDLFAVNGVLFCVLGAWMGSGLTKQPQFDA